jgi:anti-sigma factor RsiW
MRWPRRDDLHALSGAYALDAVSDVERKRFEHHLAGCPSCQREVSELLEAAGRFGVAVSARPPDGMRARVLEAVAADAAKNPAAVTRPREVPAAGTGAGEVPAASTRPREVPAAGARQRRAWAAPWSARLALPLVAACLALAIAFGVLFAINQGQLSSSQTQEDRIADVLSSPGTRVISRTTSAGGLVTVDVAGPLRELVVTTDDMPGLPASEVYQVWVLGPGGKTASDGILSQIPDHRTAPVLATGLVRGDKMGLTVEPAGGTAKPTTRPIVDISLPT